MAIQNITDIANIVAPELVQRIEFIITILKAVGIIFLIYLIYLIFSAIVNWKNNRRIKEIHNKIENIEIKINEIEKAVSKKK